MELAGSHPELAACVAYSAKTVDRPTVRKIRSPLLLLYGSEDKFMTRDLPDFVKETIDQGKDLTLRVYPSAGHEFFDHTNKAGFQPSAAHDAWEASVDFLTRNLSVDQRRASQG